MVFGRLLAGCPPCGGHVLEWCRDYGKGRVFYSALGHNPKDFAKPEFLEHILQAARWTMKRTEGAKE